MAIDVTFFESSEGEQRKSWRERWQSVRLAFANLPRALGLAWRADRPSTIGMALLTLISASLPAAQAWAGKLIVDSVVGALSGGLAVEAGLRSALPYLVLEFALLAISSLLTQGRGLLEHILHARLQHNINVEIIRKALALDLQYFEDASFYDKLQNARREADWRSMSVINSSFLLLQTVITLASFLAILLAFSPVIALILLCATVPAFIVQTRYSSLHFRLLTWNAPEFRRMRYLEHLLTVNESVKEVKLFGLGEPLLKRYDDLFWRFFHQDAALARRRSALSALWGIFGTLTFYGAYGWIIWQTVGGRITLGDMTLYLTICRQAQGAFQGLLSNISELYESGLFLDNLFGFLALTPQMQAQERPLPIPRPILQGIEFRNVSFRYPDREEWALRDLSLHIAPGEKLALVGPNGAGKTTMIKLLTRLYDPSEGQILLDGVDLREYDLDDLRAAIGVIFQDFVRYYVTARENVGFGQIAALDDEARIVLASQRGGADEVFAALPQGFETMLGRWFAKGQELSGGQWQKIALSRAFMRDGQVLVLDEPTAALDAEHEYMIFQRFRELTEGKTALLVSHRFSTVRMADRIAVLEGGGLTELGSHQELLALDGTYARLFNMQAEGYR
jgi:ATP-binding cassette subfamily B protein